MARKKKTKRSPRAAGSARTPTVRTLEREILENTASEQRRIGQELHDGVGQELTALALMLGTLKDAVAKRCPDELPLTEKLLAGLKHVLGQVRALARGLVTVEVDAEGLTAALQELAGRISDQTGIECRFHCENAVRVKANSVATHLFRIAQESVANALTHGKAHTIDITLASSGGVLRLIIEDDGRGIPHTVKSSGLGLKIMQHRAKLIGARFQIERRDGGTRVACELHGHEQ